LDVAGDLKHTFMGIVWTLQEIAYPFAAPSGGCRSPPTGKGLALTGWRKSITIILCRKTDHSIFVS